MLNNKKLIKGSIATGVILAFWLSSKVSYYKGKSDSDSEWFDTLFKIISGNLGS